MPLAAAFCVLDYSCDIDGERERTRSEHYQRQHNVGHGDHSAAGRAALFCLRAAIALVTTRCLNFSSSWRLR